MCVLCDMMDKMSEKMAADLDAEIMADLSQPSDPPESTLRLIDRLARVKHQVEREAEITELLTHVLEGRISDAQLLLRIEAYEVRDVIGMI